MQNLAVQVNYQAIEVERLSELQRSITQRLKESKELSGAFVGNLRQIVLAAVVAGNYELAKSELERFFVDKALYPNFQHRADRYRKYALDLINAIDAKRNFQGMIGLPLSKQQEIYEKVVDHFEDLKANLKVIERHEKEAKLDDIRSTVWVLKALSNSVFFIFCVAFLLDINSGLAKSFSVVFSSLVATVSDAVFALIGW
jgi:hypothetical protein